MYKIFLFCSSLAFLQAGSQTLYMPRNVQQAFKNETRSPDGKPGKNYWQNFAHYNITVTAMPPDRTIKGSEQINYMNNSPDTLHNVVIRIIENIHKPGALRFGNASKDYLTDGVSIDAFSINGAPQKWKESPQSFYMAKCKTCKSLAPTRFCATCLRLALSGIP